jgi:hypothetical protein
LRYEIPLICILQETWISKGLKRSDAQLICTPHYHRLSLNSLFIENYHETQIDDDAEAEDKTESKASRQQRRERKIGSFHSPSASVIHYAFLTVSQTSCLHHPVLGLGLAKGKGKRQGLGVGWFPSATVAST